MRSCEEKAKDLKNEMLESIAMNNLTVNNVEIDPSKYTFMAWKRPALELHTIHQSGMTANASRDT